MRWTRSYRAVSIYACMLAGVAGAIAYLPLRRALDEAAIARALEGIEPSPDGSHHLVLEAVDAATGAALPEAGFTVYEANAQTPERITAQGRFDRVMPPNARQFRYTVSAPGYATQTWSLGIGRGDDYTVSIRVPVPAPRSVGGQVLDESGAPVADAAVDLFAGLPMDGETGQRHYHGETRTGPGGRWALADVPADCEGGWLAVTHPDYAPLSNHGFTLGSDPAHDLEAVLQRGHSFGGRIADIGGKGIAGAAVNLECTRGEAVSDGDGRFAFAHLPEACFDAPARIAVRAPGYAAHYKRIEPGTLADGYEAVLQADAAPRVLLLDAQGRPLRGARATAGIEANGEEVDYRTWTSGADGAAVLDEMPAAATVRVSAVASDGAAYSNSDRVVLRGGGAPQAVRLQPHPAATIVAKDARTGRMLDRFAVTPGYARYEDRGVRWWRDLVGWRRISDERNWRHTGRFMTARLYEEPFDDGSRAPMCFRVEADGYYPAETRPFTGARGNKTFVVRLWPGEAARILPVDAAGAAAADAIAWWTPAGDSMRFSENRFSANGMLRHAAREPEGWLRLPPVDKAAHTLVVTAAGGYAIVPGAAVAPDARVPLGAWGRVEIALDEAAARLAERGVALEYDGMRAGTRVVSRANLKKRAGGRYASDRILPGDYMAGPVQRVVRGRWTTESTVPWSAVAVRAGETAEVRLAGGRAVRGRFDLPEEVRAWVQRRQERIGVQRDDLRPVRPWDPDAFLTLAPDGSFSVDALPPGRYCLRDFHFLDPAKPDSGQPIRYWAQTTWFTVPEEAGDGTPIDLGAVPVVGQEQRDAPLPVGSPAPPFLVELADGRRLRLEDWRGRWGLLVFWSLWRERDSAALMPVLEDLWNAYGQRGGFAMAGIGMAEERADFDAFVEEHAPAWPQAFVEGWNGGVIAGDYRVQRALEAFLIDPEGKIAASSMESAAIENAVRAAIAP